MAAAVAVVYSCLEKKRQFAGNQSGEKKVHQVSAIKFEVTIQRSVIGTTAW